MSNNNDNNNMNNNSNNNINDMNRQIEAAHFGLNDQEWDLLVRAALHADDSVEFAGCIHDAVHNLEGRDDVMQGRLRLLLWWFASDDQGFVDKLYELAASGTSLN